MFRLQTRTKCLLRPSPADICRRTRISLGKIDETGIGDVCCGDEHDTCCLSEYWVGETVFDKLHIPPPGYEVICGRRMRKQTTTRPGDMVRGVEDDEPEPENKAIADWQVNSEQVKEARIKRGFSAVTDRILMLGMYA